MKHATKPRQRVRWMPEMDSERTGLQTLLAFAYGMQVGRARRIALELQRLAQQAQLASMASGAAIAIASDHGIECISRAGDLAPQLGSRPEVGLSSECIRTGISQICADTETDPVVDRIRSRTSGVRSVIYIPLFRGSQPAGVIGVFSDKPGHFTEHDLRVLYLIGREVTKLLKWGPTGSLPFPAPPSASVVSPAAEETSAATPSLTTPANAFAPAIPETPNSSGKEEAPGSGEIDGWKSREPASSPSVDVNPSSPEVAGSRLQFACLEFTDEERFRRWPMIAAVVLAGFVALGAGAAWWLLRSPQQDAYPIVYGSPQVTTDSPLPSLAQNLSGPAEASSDTSSSVGSLTPTNLPSPAIPPISAQIETVRTQATGGHTFVSIYLSAAAQFQVHQLKTPDRIYVDFGGVDVSPQMKATKIDGTGSVAQFRLANSANAARLVMVLENPCTYMVSVTSDPHVIVFDLQPHL